MIIKRIVCEVDDKVHTKIKRKALVQGKTIKQITTELLEKWLKEKK